MSTLTACDVCMFSGIDGGFRSKCLATFEFFTIKRNAVYRRWLD